MKINPVHILDADIQRVALAKANKTIKLQLLEFQHEYRFAAEYVGTGKGTRQRLIDAGLRDWRFDFAWPKLWLKFAVEIEGGGWIGGRHTRGKGFADDLLKYHHAHQLGWIIYRCDVKMVENGLAIQAIEGWMRMIRDRRVQ